MAIQQMTIIRISDWLIHPLIDIFNQWLLVRAYSLCGSAGKESACNVGHLGSIPGLGRYPGEGKGYTPYSGLENSMDWIVNGVTKSQTQVSNFHLHSTSEIKTWISQVKLPEMLRSYILRRPDILPYFKLWVICMQLALKNWLWRK